MRCPSCQEKGTLRRIGRIGIYPVPILLVMLGARMAMFWGIGRRWRWRCGACGEELVRHSLLSRLWRIFFWIALAIPVLYIVFEIAMIFIFPE